MELTKLPCQKTKEWTSDNQGLELTLAVTIPPVPSKIVVGPFYFERESIQTVWCITVVLPYDQYGMLLEHDTVYQPARHWPLLITTQQSSDLVNPSSLRSCLEVLRTVASKEFILCFHIIDLYRGKRKFQCCQKLIIVLLSRFPRIRSLDEWIHAFDEPVSFCSALSTLDTWSEANIDNQPLTHSVWQDLTAIKGHRCREKTLRHDTPGLEIRYRDSLRPQLVYYVSYDHKDFFQDPHHNAMCCMATLETSFAVLRYVFREHGLNKIFRLRPKVSTVIALPHLLDNDFQQVTYPLIVVQLQAIP